MCNSKSKKVTYVNTYVILVTTSRIGYTLKGQYTSALNGTRVTSDTRVTQAKDHTLYAQWKM